MLVATVTTNVHLFECNSVAVLVVVMSLMMPISKNYLQNLMRFCVFFANHKEYKTNLMRQVEALNGSKSTCSAEGRYFFTASDLLSILLCIECSAYEKNWFLLLLFLPYQDSRACFDIVFEKKN